MATEFHNDRPIPKAVDPGHWTISQLLSSTIKGNRQRARSNVCASANDAKGAKSPGDVSTPDDFAPWPEERPPRGSGYNVSSASRES